MCVLWVSVSLNVWVGGWVCACQHVHVCMHDCTWACIKTYICIFTFCGAVFDWAMYLLLKIYCFLTLSLISTITKYCMFYSTVNILVSFFYMMSIHMKIRKYLKLLSILLMWVMSCSYCYSLLDLSFYMVTNGLMYIWCLKDKNCINV